MPDALIRNPSTENLNLLDEQAARLGISRSEYLHLHLHREARQTVGSVTVADLRALGEGVAVELDDGVPPRPLRPNQQGIPARRPARTHLAASGPR